MKFSLFKRKSYQSSALIQFWFKLKESSDAFCNRSIWLAGVWHVLRSSTTHGGITAQKSATWMQHKIPLQRCSVWFYRLKLRIKSSADLRVAGTVWFVLSILPQFHPFLCKQQRFKAIWLYLDAASVRIAAIIFVSCSADVKRVVAVQTAY